MSTDYTCPWRKSPKKFRPMTKIYSERRGIKFRAQNNKKMEKGV